MSLAPRRRASCNVPDSLNWECGCHFCDWLSEMNIAWNAIIKRESIDTVADKKIKIVTGASVLDTAALTRKVEELCISRG